MYKVGQVVNVGYYGGFQNRTLIKTQAEITAVDEAVFGTWIKVRVKLSSGGYKKMFGYASELQCMEEKYCK